MEQRPFPVTYTSHGVHHRLVFFDLETTGLGTMCDIIQLSAVSGDHTFNVYMVPRQPIQRGASVITGFRVRRQQLYLHNRSLPTNTLREALTSFLAFLHMFHKPLLAGHNIRRFDCPVLLRALDEVHLRGEFKHTISGFLDTLLLARELLKDTSIQSFRQENLVKMILGTSYQAHNALEDVKALQRLCCAWMPTSEQVLRHTFTLAQMEAQASLLPLVQGKAISKPTASKLASWGVTLEKLKEAQRQCPPDGLKQLLEPLKENLKDASFRTIAGKISDFLKQLQCPELNRAAS
ncbi:PML protein, partial [Amia calva]|nr:PML protein [Amia calva]